MIRRSIGKCFLSERYSKPLGILATFFLLFSSELYALNGKLIANLDSPTSENRVGNGEPAVQVSSDDLISSRSFRKAGSDSDKKYHWRDVRFSPLYSILRSGGASLSSELGYAPKTYFPNGTYIGLPVDLTIFRLNSSTLTVSVGTQVEYGYYISKVFALELGGGFAYWTAGPSHISPMASLNGLYAPNLPILNIDYKFTAGVSLIRNSQITLVAFKLGVEVDLDSITKDQ